MKKRFLALLCVAMMLCTLLPTTAAANSLIDDLIYQTVTEPVSADNAITKVLCTISSVPVANGDSREIYANTSTNGCYIEGYTWRECSTGYIVYQLFPKGNVEVEIRLRAYDGWIFSDSVAVYLNNSSVSFYLGDGGKTLTLNRTYAPELWQPSVIKNPGSETVDKGGIASFVATATLTEEYTWYIVDPVSGKSHSAYDIPSLFEGAAIGSNREGQLNIHNVPAAMDGWQVYCVFSGPGGEVKSQKANIKVKYETPPPTETPAPTPEATAKPEVEAETAPAVENKPAAPTVQAPDHAHSFSAQWKHNDALHWRECDCGAKTEEGVHMLTWSKEREASKREPGLSVGECPTCGYRAEKEIAYDNTGGILRYIVYGLGGLVVLTIIVLVIDSIRANRRRRRRRKRRR